jgi:hypothetical protein
MRLYVSDGGTLYPLFVRTYNRNPELPSTNGIPNNFVYLVTGNYLKANMPPKKP